MTYEKPRPQIYGWMADNELQWLYERAKDMASVVEVGCWLGRSTHALCSGCRGPVYAVDHWRGSPSERATQHRDATLRDIFPEFWVNVGHFPNLIVVRKPSVDAASEFGDASVDMVFIDGDHDYPAVLDDLRAWRPKCRRLLCGHDRGQGGVPQALREFGQPITDGPGVLWSIVCAP